MSGAIQLTEVDFEEIKQNLVDYLKSTRKFTDFDFDGSNLQVILNLISYQAQLNAYSTNMVANESFLTSSSIRKNVVANAEQIGYLPTSARGSKTRVSFEFQLRSEDYPNGLPTFLEINPGMAFSTRTKNTNFVFNITDSHIAGVKNSGICRFEDIEVTEGVFLSDNFTVDDSDFNQRFILKNKNIDTTTVRVEVQEDPNEDVTVFYREANNLVALTQESKVFWISETSESFYQLTFGDGFFGKKLRDGVKINVTYLVTNGSLANGVQGSNSMTYVATTKDSYGNTITDRPFINSVDVSEGGAEIESVPSIKFRAPKSYAAQTRAVTSEDYDAIVRQIFPAVDDIYVYGGEEMDIPQYGRVFIVIKPSTGDSLSTITKNEIKESLRQFRVGSLDIRLVDPEVLYVEVDSVVFYDDKRTLKDNSLIVAAVNETLTKYAQSDNVSKFGGAARYSRVLGAIDDSDDSITRNNTSFRMRKDMKVVENTRASYEVCFENELKFDPQEPVIYSTGFRLEIDGVVDLKTYYFENIPTCEGETMSNLRLFYFDIDNNKIIVNKEWGTVDIIKGEVLIGYQKPVTFVDTIEKSSVVQIRGIPKEQDVLAKRSVYLQMDISQSNVDATVDTKISGS